MLNFALKLGEKCSNSPSIIFLYNSSIRIALVSGHRKECRFDLRAAFAVVKHQLVQSFLFIPIYSIRICPLEDLWALIKKKKVIKTPDWKKKADIRWKNKQTNGVRVSRWGVCVWVRALAEETRSEAVSHVSCGGDGRQRLVTTRSCEFEGSK